MGKTEFKKFLQHFEIWDLVFLLHFRSDKNRRKTRDLSFQIVVKPIKTMCFPIKTKITHEYEPDRHFPEDISAKKLFP